ncbi:MAG: serine/threonine-protein kinase [Myxococcota bacterium]
MSAPLGKFANDLVLLDRIATGGMAEVFRANLIGTGDFQRQVAVKRVLPHFAEDVEFKKMFQYEGNLCARFSHPNIAQVVRADEFQGFLYLVIEYVDGKNIAQLQLVCEQRQARIPVEIACFIIAEAAKALDYAHECTDDRGRPMNVIHRDISPQNIMISYDGNVKVVDFGIARAADRAELTDAGVVKGKVPYMSPEQARGEEIDRRTDVFALGVVFHELLTQRRLFKGNNRAATMDRITRGPIAPPSTINPKVGPDLDRIVMQALNRDLNERYQSARALLRDLTPYMNQQFPRFLPTEEMSKFMRNIFAAEIAQERMRREESKAIEPTIQTPSSGSGRKVSTAGRLEAVPGPVPPPATAPVVVPIITQGKGALLGIPQAQLLAEPGVGGPGSGSQAPLVTPLTPPRPTYTTRSQAPIKPVEEGGTRLSTVALVVVALLLAAVLGYGFNRWHLPVDAKIPTLLPGIAVWYRADLIDAPNDGPVGVWRDSSPNGVDAMQTDPERQPTLNRTGPNYLPVVRFDGRDDFLVADRVANGLRQASAMTAIYVARSLSNNVSYVWSMHEQDQVTDVCRAGFARGDTLRVRAERETGIYHDVPGQLINAFTISSVLFYPDHLEMWVDGKQKLTAPLKTPILFNRAHYFSLGQEWDDDSKPSDFLNGELAELVIYARSLTTDERRAIELYLARKYGLNLEP